MAQLVFNPFLGKETLCIKKGKTKDGKQKYLCKETNKVFVEVEMPQETKKKKQTLEVSSEKSSKNKLEKVNIMFQNFDCKVSIKKVTSKNKISKKKVLAHLLNYIANNYEFTELNDGHIFIKVK